MLRSPGDSPSRAERRDVVDSLLGLWRRSLAEGLATFALVFAGCGAIVADAQYDGALGAVGISLVFGLVIMAMIYATGHLSGARNPAVTLAFTLTRHFPPRDALSYVAAQLAGARWALCSCWPPGASARPAWARRCRAWPSARRSPMRWC